MLPEETQVEDVLHHQCNAAYASTLSEFFLALGALFLGLSTCPPKCLCTCLSLLLRGPWQRAGSSAENRTREWTAPLFDAILSPPSFS